MAQISMNPMKTTNAQNCFGIVSDGLYQGVALDDPANRYNLASGTVDEMEDKPLWGGVPIATFLPGIKSSPRGSNVMRGYNPALMTGFSVFNQAHNGITTPQSPVPQFATGMSVSYYRFGSNMRVPVKCSEAVVALGTTRSNINQKLAWDFANEQVDLAKNLVISMEEQVKADVVTIKKAKITLNVTSGDISKLKPGMYVTCTYSDGVIDNNTGVTPVLEINGQQMVIADPSPNGVTGKTLSFFSSVVLDVKLPVELIEIESGNSKVCEYDETTGYLTWKDGANCALLLL